MKRPLVRLLLVAALSASAIGQEVEPEPTPEKRSWFSRLFGRRDRLPEYKDPRLNGLVLSVKLSPQPIKLSEMRQMDVQVTLANRSRRPITLEFPNSQRFEIYLRSSTEKILLT
ncbi:MAG TPA: BsuPI-related putative proteinase inhibitor, partial [Chthoniobacterales bacterium]|nr:BsuPI-related putative proteinase inhibitor [Chthoniobacterales bacterium]